MAIKNPKNVTHKVANYVFKEIAKGKFERADTVRSRDWFRKKMQKFSERDIDQFERQNKGYTQRRLTPDSIGRMYMFIYDAKLKDELPYWDKFPLIFPFGLDEKGFIGINLHYLPPSLRGVLMDNLETIMNNDRYDNSTKLKMSYEYLKANSKFNKLIQPCIKRYLHTQVRSRFIMIPSSEWLVAAFLPTQRWQKASAHTVYRDSRNMVNR